MQKNIFQKWFSKKIIWKLEYFNLKNIWASKFQNFMGGSPGLVVMGGASFSEGCGFESRRHILDGHIFTLICCKIVSMFVWKRPKIKEKEAGMPQLKKIKISVQSNLFFTFKTILKVYPPFLRCVGTISKWNENFKSPIIKNSFESFGSSDYLRQP